MYICISQDVTRKSVVRADDFSMSTLNQQQKTTFYRQMADKNTATFLKKARVPNSGSLSILTQLERKC